MKQKVKFKAVRRGSVINFTHIVECPDFKVIPSKNFKGVDLPEVSVERQVIRWLDGQDKSKLMYEKDVDLILDYCIPVKQKGKVNVINLIMKAEVPDGLRADLLAVYKKIKPTLKGKSVNNQIDLIFSHLTIAHYAATAAYRNIKEVLNPDSKKNTDVKLLGDSRS